MPPQSNSADPHKDHKTAAADAPQDDEKQQIDAIVWVFLAVGAILVGLIVLIALWKQTANGGAPGAAIAGLEIIKGVIGVVGTATSKVATS